jgi:hypothetical protein
LLDFARIYAETVKDQGKFYIDIKKSTKIGKQNILKMLPFVTSSIYDCIGHNEPRPASLTGRTEEMKMQEG